MNSKLLNIGWSAMIYKIGTDYWLTNPKVRFFFTFVIKLNNYYIIDLFKIKAY